MTDWERRRFAQIVVAETDPYQRMYVSRVLEGNSRHLAPLALKSVEPAVRRLWKI